MPTLLPRLLHQRIQHSPLLNALPQTRRHRRRPLILLSLAGPLPTTTVRIPHHLRWPIDLLLPFPALLPKLALAQPIQDAPERLVRDAALRGDLASRQPRQLRDRVPGGLGRVGVVVQPLCDGDLAR